MNDFSISVPWCLLVAIFWGVTNPFMKRGADGIETVAEEGRVSQVLHELKYLLLNWKYYVPFLLNQFGSVLYFWTLSTSNLSVVVPLTNSLTFLIASVTGRFLGEEIGGAYFYLGVSLIPTRVTPYDFDWLRVSNEAVTECKDLLDANRLSSEERKKLERIFLALKDELILRFSDLAFLHRCKVRSNEFTGEESIHLSKLFHKLNCEQILPRPEPLVRSPELEARLAKIKVKLEEEEYRQMTSNVHFAATSPESLGKELKKIDSQILSMVNFVLTVVGSFVFGYKAVEFSLPSPNVPMQLMVGTVLATLVFFADLYFIIKDYGKEDKSA